MHPEIKRAREILARRKDVEAEFAADRARRELEFIPLERTPPLQQSSTTMTHEPNWGDWNQWCEAHVESGMQRVAQICGEEVHAIEADLLKRIELLEQKVGELTAESHVRHCAEVFDLPNWRSRHVA